MKSCRRRSDRLESRSHIHTHLIREDRVLLVLSRQAGERIMIDGGAIVVSIEEIRGEKVRLGVEAPAGVRIDREQIHRERQREAAAGTTPE